MQATHFSTPEQALQHYFGYGGFRGVQKPIVEAVLQGHHTLALLPTGGGKSICFQLPALMLPGLCIVVTPLIALMKDQVEQLVERGIPALALHSGTSGQALRHLLQKTVHGHYKFLYVSPERLQTKLWQEFLPALEVNLIAVDEAHCISQWGYDFRPAYLQIAQLLKALPDVPVLALTASATAEVQTDMVQQLGLKNVRLFRQSFARPNLSYSVLEVPNKLPRLIEVLAGVRGSALVYCRSRHRCQDLCLELAQMGQSVDYYHAGLPAEERSERQSRWLRGQCRIMVCTNAFGMGINKPDVRLVVHMDVPESLEQYYQEAGRAGRDGLKSYAVLLYTPVDDDARMKELVAQRFPSLSTLRMVYGHLAHHLQVAAGAGEGQSYPFNLLAFAKTFGLDTQLAYNALRILEQEEFIRYNDHFLQPANVQVVAPIREIRALEEAADPIEDIIKACLRSYEGVMDYPVNIYERVLAKHLLWPETKVKEQLLLAHKRGYLNYVPAQDKPHLQFCQPRVEAALLQINEAAYSQRKQRYEQRLATMRHYLTQEGDCRSWLIGRYFGDGHLPACGICDHCLARKQRPPNPAQQQLYRRLLAEQLAHGPKPVEALLAAVLPQIRRRHFWFMLELLQREKMMEVDRLQWVRWVG